MRLSTPKKKTTMSSKQPRYTLLRLHGVFIVSCTCLFVMGVILAATWYRYQINPDATSYFMIARHYANFDFRDAINGYWGPFLSWLLVPAVWLHISLIVAAKVISLAAVLAIAVTVYSGLLRYDSERTVAYIFAILLFVGGLVDVLSGPVTPDILEALWFVWFALELVKFSRRCTTKRAVLLGVLGALMYFTKAFGLFLYVATIVVVVLAEMFIKRRWDIERHVKNYWVVALTLAILCLPFIGVISMKYHKLTINSAGNFDLNLVGPISQGNYYPMIAGGPIAPPNKAAISVWEDPSKLTPLFPDAGWSPLQSKKDARYYLFSVLLANVRSTIADVKAASIVVAIGLLIMVVGCFGKGKFRREFAVFSVSSIFAMAGYALILTGSRYILGVFYLAILAAGMAAYLLRKKGFLSYLQVIVLGIILLGSACYGTLENLVANRYENRSDYLAARSLQGALPVHAGVLSDSFSSVYTCYYLQLRCYGDFNSGTDTLAQYASVLKDGGIGYFINFHTEDSSPVLTKFLADYTHKVGQTKTGGASVTIYRLD